jgi:hypothetical protein
MAKLEVIRLSTSYVTRKPHAVGYSIKKSPTTPSIPVLSILNLLANTKNCRRCELKKFDVDRQRELIGNWVSDL